MPCLIGCEGHVQCTVQIFQLWLVCFCLPKRTVTQKLKIYLGYQESSQTGFRWFSGVFFVLIVGCGFKTAPERSLRYRHGLCHHAALLVVCEVA